MVLVPGKDGFPLRELQVRSEIDRTESLVGSEACFRHGSPGGRSRANQEETVQHHQTGRRSPSRLLRGRSRAGLSRGSLQYSTKMPKENGLQYRGRLVTLASGTLRLFNGYLG